MPAAVENCVNSSDWSGKINKRTGKKYTRSERFAICTQRHKNGNLSREDSMEEVTFKAKFSPVKLGNELDEKYKVLRGDLIHAGTHHPGNLPQPIYMPWDVLKASASSFNMTKSTFNHDRGIMDRNGWLDNVIPVDASEKLIGDLLIPRIDKNKDFIDMIDAQYKGDSLIDNLSVTFRFKFGDDESIIDKHGPYVKEMMGTGVGFVDEGADPDAHVTEVLNKKNKVNNMDDKDIGDIKSLFSDDSKMAAYLEKNGELVSDKDKEIEALQGKLADAEKKGAEFDSMKEKIDTFEKAKAEKDEEELKALRTELKAKFPNYPDEKIQEMSREAIEAVLDTLKSVSGDPDKSTDPEKGSDSRLYKSDTELTYERLENGKVAFYAEKPAYIPDHVAGGEMMKVLGGGN